MPTYEYQCQKCDHQFELFQRMSADPLTTCPEEQCPHKPWGKGKVKRLIGAGAGLLFKGSGFYITDYRSQGYQQAAKKESEGGSSSSEKKGKEAKKNSSNIASETKKGTTSSSGKSEGGSSSSNSSRS
jgi:putative FmdB family regulatory protein